MAGAPLTTSATYEAAPGLLRNAIDERIVRIRPMSTPIDQISRCAGSRHCGAMTVDYYAVDTKPTQTTVKTDLSDVSVTDRGNDLYTFALEVADHKIFDPTDTVLFPAVSASAAGNEWLVCYVVEVNASEGKLILAPVNAVKDGSGKPQVPDIDSGAVVVRMGRAAAELDVQTAQFQALPKKSSNHCQIFKMQVEQSTLQKIADKEVGWTFSDQEEAAVIDMRLGIEKNFLFGAKAKITDSTKGQDVYLTGGIWYQTDHEHKVRLATLGEAQLISLCTEAFRGNCGSKNKILLAGTGLMEAISKIELTRAVKAEQPLVKWGLKFREIVTNFGSLFVIHSETFDQCNHPNDGMVIDPDFITKYSHIPFSAETLDLRSSGQRNTDAVVLTEASCLTLRYPQAHMRVICE